MTSDPGGPVVLIHEHVSGGGLAGEHVPASWLAEGSAMRRALARDFAEAGARVAMTLDPRLPDEPGPWSTRRLGPGPAAEAVASLARDADYTIPIAPEIGGLLRDLALALESAGARSLGSEPEAINLAANKLRLAEHLGPLGIPTPPSRRVRPHLGLPRDAPYPAVLKPIDGVGSIDTLYVASPEDPIAEHFPDDPALLQPFLPGQPRSASFLARPGERPTLLGIGLQAIALEGGRFSYNGGTILRDGLPDDHPARLAVASVAGLAGLVGVDYLHEPMTGAAVVIEINPRPTTSCVGLVSALGPGRLASAWLALAAGEGMPPPPLPARTVSFRPEGPITTPLR